MHYNAIYLSIFLSTCSLEYQSIIFLPMLCKPIVAGSTTHSYIFSLSAGLFIIYLWSTINPGFGSQGWSPLSKSFTFRTTGMHCSAEPDILREAAKKGSFLVARHLRGGGVKAEPLRKRTFV